MLTRRTLLGTAAAVASAPWLSPVTAESNASSHARAIACAMQSLPRAAPLAVAERTAWTLLDALGAMLYATTLPEAMTAAGYFASSAHRGGIVIPAADLSANAAQAAAATAFLIHAAEIDDSDMRGQLRASAVIMAAALAAAQEADASGADFIRAAALGYTLQGRFAAPVGAIQARGWMASGVWGPPSAAAATALLKSLPADQVSAAISLAGSTSGGLFQYYFDQTEEKRLIVARAARAAIESAELAAIGEHGAPHIIEGRAGLYQLFGGVEAPPSTHFTERLGDLEGPLFVRPKYFAASHSIIPTLDGLAAVAPQGIDPSNVVRIVVRGDPAWEAVIGEKINSFEAPTTQIGAALNFSYVVGLWIARGRVLPTDYTPAAMRDEAILALARKSAFETALGQHLSIEVVLKNGEIIRASAADPEPDELAPFERERRLEKFRGLSASRLSEKKTEELQMHCLDVAKAQSMRDWARRAQTICA